MTRRTFLFSIPVFILLVMVLPGVAKAQASLSISPSSGRYHVGEAFSVLVTVDTGNEAINAASGQINFNNNVIDVVDIGYTRSIFTLWTEEPSFSNQRGTIKFSGGLPSPGYTGRSGAILRVTFKPKAEGSASAVFLSGAVLANDGSGTNILDATNGAVFSIVPAPKDSAKNTAAIEPTPDSATESIPVITEYSPELQEGDVLTIKGLAYPSGKILIFIQHARGIPISEERFVGSDGRFSHNFGDSVKSGIYTVWVKNVDSKTNVPGASSESVTIQVVKPLFIRIGTVAVNYFSVIITLIALIVLLGLAVIWLALKVRRWQMRRGTEVSVAEQALHGGFDKLREGLSAYVSYLTEAKSVEAIRSREYRTKHELKHQIDDIEKELEKDIEQAEKEEK